MKEEVFSFVHNKIEYHVMKKNNEYIPYKVINKINDYNLTQEEFELVNKVFNKIKLTNDVIQLSNIRLFGNEYKHIYDKTNCWHLFLNIDGSLINKKIFKKLNMIYNYQDNVVYDKENNKKDNILKRLVKIGKATILVLVTSTALISPLSTLTPAHAQTIYETYVDENGNTYTIATEIPDEVEDKYEKKKGRKHREIQNNQKDTSTDVQENIIKEQTEYRTVVETITEDGITITRSYQEPINYNQYNTPAPIIDVLTNEQKVENLRKAVLDNQNLNYKEKEFILQDFDIIEKHIDYLDYEALLDVHKTMRIEYNPNTVRDANGEWHPTDKLLVVYHVSSIDDIINNPSLLSTIHHELKHKNQIYINNERHNGFYEPMTSILANEFNGIKISGEIDDSYCQGYRSTFGLIYALTKIASQKALLTAYYTGDYSILKSELMNLIDDENMYYELITSLDSINNLNRYSLSSQANIEQVKCEKILDDYHKAKYNKSMYEDIDIVYSLNSVAFSNTLKDVYSNEEFIKCNNNTVHFYNDNHESKITARAINKDAKTVMSFNEAINYMLNNNIINSTLYKQLQDMYYDLTVNKNMGMSLQIEVLLFQYGASFNSYTDYTVKIYGYKNIVLDNNFIKENKTLLNYYINDYSKSIIKLSNELSINIADGTLIYQGEELVSEDSKTIAKKILNYVYKNDTDLDEYKIMTQTYNDTLSIKIYSSYYKKESDFEVYNLNTKTQQKISGKSLITNNHKTSTREINRYVKKHLISLINNTDFHMYTTDMFDIRDLSNTEIMLNLLDESMKLFKTKYIYSPFYDENGNVYVTVPLVYNYYGNGNYPYVLIDVQIPANIYNKDISISKTK